MESNLEDNSQSGNKRFELERAKFELEKHQFTLDKSKHDLERSGLERNRTLPRWLQIVLGVLPTLLAIGGLASVAVTGYFGSERNKLETRRDLLEMQIDNFEKQKSQLTDSVAVLRDSVSLLSRVSAELKDSLTGERLSKREILDSLHQTYVVMASSRDSLNLFRGAELRLADRIELLSDELSSSLTNSIFRGIPTIYLAAALRLYDEGRESMYFRGLHFGNEAGQVRLSRRRGDATFWADSTVSIVWSDSLIVLSATGVHSEFFAQVRTCHKTPNCTIEAMVSTKGRGLSNLFRLSVK